MLARFPILLLILVCAGLLFQRLSYGHGASSAVAEIVPCKDLTTLRDLGPMLRTPENARIGDTLKYII